MKLYDRILISILVLALGLSYNNTSLPQTEQESTQDPLFALWYVGSIALDDEYRGKRTYPVVLRVVDVRRRGYFHGLLWYQEADVITDIYGRLTAVSELRWFIEGPRLYPNLVDGRDFDFRQPFPGPIGGDTIIYYKGYGHNWATAILGFRSASWDLRPAMEQQLTMTAERASQ